MELRAYFSSVVQHLNEVQRGVVVGAIAVVLGGASAVRPQPRPRSRV